ncbi:MAG: PHP domain-containing protein [candidate division Zixibacteria bacterium]|nr:PHP domain-containing protein [candidate division Zixibacteria bacterium]
MPDKYQQIVGAIHIHSNYSDGTKTIPEIANLANEVGLDFIMITDHMTLEPYQQGLEGFYGKTAVLIGYEINDADDKNHYLAFGLDQTLPSDLKAVDYVRQVNKKGGLGIIAHPDEVRSKLVKYPGYPWSDWRIEGYDGIEIWNHMSQWMESLSHWNMLKQAFMPRRALKSPTNRILKIWDEKSQKQRILGIGSIDVHAYPYKLGPLRVTIFPYKVQFKAIRTHLLLSNEVKSDFGLYKQAIYDSLRRCRAFISNYRWGDAAGFEFYCENSAGRAWSGDDLTWEEDSIIMVSLPKYADLKIIQNGQQYFFGRGREFEIKASRPGLYRVEVYVRDKGWIFSNHIRIKKRG